MRFFATSLLGLGLSADLTTYALAKGKGGKIGKRGACKDVKIQIVETFDSITSMCMDTQRTRNPDTSNGCAGAQRLAGDFDVWDDAIYLMAPPTDQPPESPCDVTGQLTQRLGTHRGRCAWVGDSANHCEGTMSIDHPDYGKGDISIMGQSPIPIGDFAPTNPDIRFTITGGTGDFEGAYGSVTPGLQYGFDPSFQVTGKTVFQYPQFPNFPVLAELGFPDFATCPFPERGYPPFLPIIDNTFPLPTYELVPEVFMIIVYEARFSCNKAVF